LPRRPTRAYALCSTSIAAAAAAADPPAPGGEMDDKSGQVGGPDNDASRRVRHHRFLRCRYSCT
jgi:hypothetical protein